ncbi:hypothetical protein [Pseudomonas sp. DSP3-2-2]|uniref:hypothetical protein n=1 Tax=unclassified Pseudomonas TaxID=196821 RepID=UPI003CEB80BD
MLVIAAPGHRVPMENEPLKSIEADPVEVPDTSYYRRRIAAGELLPAPKKRAGAKETAQQESAE